MHHLFNGEGHYNQSYPTNGKFDDYELFQVTVNWRQILCFKNWYSDTKNSLIGSAVYSYEDHTEFCRFEIVFDQANATSFYANALTVTRVYPDGRQEYDYTNVILNTISGLRVTPR